MKLTFCCAEGRERRRMITKTPPGPTRLHHVYVQGVESLGRGAHGGGKRCAAFDLRACPGQDFLKELVFLLARQNLETLNERQTGVDHDRELARENGEFLGFHAAPEGGHIQFLALLRHFRRSDLLTLQQAGEFALVRGGHRPADAASGTAGSLIFIILPLFASSVPLTLWPIAFALVP